jgi:flavin-dependent dehydrogenase
MPRADVLVIGGGPSGATAAFLLARAGRRVTVLEKASFPRRKVCGEFVAASGLQILGGLGAGEALLASAGPEVRRVALWHAGTALEAPMPPASASAPPRYPRAIPRERLDTLLLERAAACGAEVHQPATALELKRTRDGFVCLAAARRGAPGMELEARAVIAAHGSWEPGSLPTQARRNRPRGTDLLAFKAQFRGCVLPAHAIVLSPYAGGYGGAVDIGDGSATFACCIRRDTLEALRARSGTAAGEAVFRHALAASAKLRAAFANAAREGAWMAAGPLRPGARPLCREGIFAVGNAAGESHPLAGEGLSMALRSAAFLCAPLIAALEAGYAAEMAQAVASEYRSRWRRVFMRRLWSSACYASLARHPSALEWLRAPSLVSLAMRLGGHHRA